MNPNNPYPYEISFDPHVWLPSVKENYENLSPHDYDIEELKKIVEETFQFSKEYINHAPIASKNIISKLSEHEIRIAEDKVRDMQLPVNVHTSVVIASHFFPEMMKKMGTSIINPPDHIHRMQKGDWYIGDLYSADMIANTLTQANFQFQPGKKYLDFGCSSGSLIRVLKAHASEAHFYGVDPVNSSIEWAAENVAGAHFTVSPLLPPTHFDAGSFTGATAVSIWSHLGLEEALAWFDEMHRIIEKGGWLFFTTHGETTLHHALHTGGSYPRRLWALVEGMINSDFVFEEVYLGESPEGISAKGYGNTLFKPTWVEHHLGTKWKVISYTPGANQGNQDVYLMERL